MQIAANFKTAQCYDCLQSVELYHAFQTLR